MNLYYLESRQSATDNSVAFNLAVLFSIFMHLCLFGVIAPPGQKPVEKEKLIEISLQEPPQPKVVEKTPEKSAIPLPIPPEPEQIVSPPELPETIEIPVTRLKSEKNVSTPKETLKRGEGESKKTENKLREKIPFEAPKEEKFTPKKFNLRLNSDALNELAQNESAEQSKQAARERELNKYRPFSSSSSNADIFRLNPGSPDFLPSIPDGEITLLNTKADRFAPFVRRVAQQVFGLVRKFQWHSIPASEVLRIADFVEVEAVLSPQGKLISFKINDGSGSSAFDRMIARSVQEGANDQNPPMAALAADGNFHFVFKSRCWSRPGAGGVAESRWLLLATGLL